MDCVREPIGALGVRRFCRALPSEHEPSARRIGRGHAGVGRGTPGRVHLSSPWRAPMRRLAWTRRGFWLSRLQLGSALRMLVFPGTSIPALWVEIGGPGCSNNVAGHEGFQPMSLSLILDDLARAIGAGVDELPTGRCIGSLWVCRDPCATDSRLVTQFILSYRRPLRSPSRVRHPGRRVPGPTQSCVSRPCCLLSLNHHCNHLTSEPMKFAQRAGNPAMARRSQGLMHSSTS